MNTKKTKVKAIQDSNKASAKTLGRDMGMEKERAGFVGKNRDENGMVDNENITQRKKEEQ